MPEEGKKRVRRDKETVIAEKIAKVDNAIENYNNKIKALKEQRAKFDAQLAAMKDAQAKAAEEEAMRKIAKLLKDKNMTVEELEDLVK